MKTTVRVFSLLLMISLVLGEILPVVGQTVGATSDPNAADGTNASATNEPNAAMTTCDSSLVLLYGLATRYFGYTLPQDMDLSSFDMGQYSVLFDTTTMSNAGNMSDMSNTASGTGGAGSIDGASGGIPGTPDSTGGAGVTLSTATPSGTGVTTGAGAPGSTEGGTPAPADASASSGEVTSSGGLDTGTSATSESGSAVMGTTTMDENPACTALRISLDQYFGTQFATDDWDARFRGAMGSMDSSADGMTTEQAPTSGG